MPDHSHELTVCPFRVCIDTREQAPFTFQGLRTDAKDGNRQLIVETIPTTLTTGDYSIEGMEGLVSIERKSVADFYGTILAGRDRFERELVRLQEIAAAGGYAEIVCEGDWYTEGPPMRPGDGEAERQKRIKTVYRSVIAWKHRYSLVRWDRWPSRRDAERYVFRVLERFWNERKPH